jgi:SanA protein
MKIFKFIAAHKYWVIGLLAVPVLVIVVSNLWMHLRSKELVFEDLELLPFNRVGLLLGTSRYTRGGQTNLHFRNRMDAAALLYKEGKIKHILASGDHQSDDYDECTAMKQELLKRGVPEEAISLDSSGLRTLDSVVRAREVFGLQEFTIISQKYHNIRAVFIARHHHINAVAWCAEKVVFKHSIKTEIREYFARMKALIDLYILDKRPKHLGDRVDLFADRE